jgi:DNA modification methylase
VNTTDATMTDAVRASPSTEGLEGCVRSAPTNRVLFGDCRATMRGLKAQGLRVQCCVTSPPYYGLRDYGRAGQIGLEKTPAEYVAALVEVFDCVRDLLADDGVLWLNLGDSYATRWSSARSEGRGGLADNERERHGAAPEGYKNKDLIGMPWRVAFALQAAGWYLRQDVIWHKPNPMPESVTDRCTKAHEYLFLLTKSERYYWDAEAMKEPAVSDHGAGNGFAGRQGGGTHGSTEPWKPRSKRDSFKRDASKRAEVIPGQTVGTHRPDRDESEWDTTLRNRRSVWTVPVQAYSGAHFAVFPPALIEPCILAASRPGDVVLDPFMGSGTTAQVAQQFGRAWIGCELNPEYEPLQRERTVQCGLAL